MKRLSARAYSTASGPFTCAFTLRRAQAGVHTAADDDDDDDEEADDAPAAVGVGACGTGVGASDSNGVCTACADLGAGTGCGCGNTFHRSAAARSTMSGIGPEAGDSENKKLLHRVAAPVAGDAGRNPNGVCNRNLPALEAGRPAEAGGAVLPGRDGAKAEEGPTGLTKLVELGLAARQQEGSSALKQAWGELPDVAAAELRQLQQQVRRARADHLPRLPRLAPPLLLRRPAAGA